VVSVYPHNTELILGSKETNNSTFFEYLKLVALISFNAPNSLESFFSTGPRPFYCVCVILIACFDVFPFQSREWSNASKKLAEVILCSESIYMKLSVIFASIVSETKFWVGSPITLL